MTLTMNYHILKIMNLPKHHFTGNLSCTVLVPDHQKCWQLAATGLWAWLDWSRDRRQPEQITNNMGTIRYGFEAEKGA